MRALALLALLAPSPAAAHVSERALVLLLPTDVYITAGVAAVGASALSLAVLPAGLVRAWAAGGTTPADPVPARVLPGLAALLLLGLLVLAGWFGSRDPLSNPLSLAVWTLFWIVTPVLQGLAGDLWAAAGPFRSAATLAARGSPRFRLPETIGYLPALASFLAVALFALAHPAPDDPAILARAVLVYAAAAILAGSLWGEEVWRRGEGLTVWLGLLADLAPLRRAGGRLRAALPGARLVHRAPLPASGALFVVAVLAAGSFDGFNETFLWLDLIGVNPLEHPGRSALVAETVAGLLGAVVLLALLFAGTVAAGLALAGERGRFSEAFGRLAPTLLPIAFGYHVAHYLTSLLVNGQYLAAAVAEGLGLGHVHVTASMFNVPGTVEAIWLTQAGAIVLGHVAALVVAHAVALDMFGSPRRAVLSQLPVAAFMTFYTFLGLAILAMATGT